MWTGDSISDTQVRDVPARFQGRDEVATKKIP